MGYLLERVKVEKKENSTWILKLVRNYKKNGEILINPKKFDYLKLNPNVTEFYIVRQGGRIIDVLPARKTKKSQI